MGRINKVDFFCGAFLSYLITNGIEPTLFDAGDKSKVVKFTLRNTDYNAYVKYVSTSSKGKISGKEHTLWSINFSDAENDFINTRFEDCCRENIVVLVCGNENLRDTCLAVLSLNEAKTCLGEDNKNTQRRISVKHSKGGRYLSCYGTALPDTRAIKLKYNYDEYFGF